MLVVVVYRLLIGHLTWSMASHSNKAVRLRLIHS